MSGVFSQDSSASKTKSLCPSTDHLDHLLPSPCTPSTPPLPRPQDAACSFWLQVCHPVAHPLSLLAFNIWDDSLLLFLSKFWPQHEVLNGRSDPILLGWALPRAPHPIPTAGGKIVCAPAAGHLTSLRGSKRARTFGNPSPLGMLRRDDGDGGVSLKEPPLLPVPVHPAWRKEGAQLQVAQDPGLPLPSQRVPDIPWVSC